MLNKLTPLCLLLAIFSVAGHAFAQQKASGEFPFFRSFLDGNLESISFPTGTGGRTNSATLDKQNYRGLILTQGTGEVGAFTLPLHTFSSEDGFLIEFEYIMTGPDDLTDGITLFLVNAQDLYSLVNLQFGAPGAGFGYTHNISFGSMTHLQGMKSTYLAVALDQGPFKTLRMESNEMRNGMVYNDDPEYSTGVQAQKYDTRSNVTIRGAAGNASRQFIVGNKFYNMNEAYWGYPVLITRHTGWSPDYGLNDPYNLRNDAGFKLNPTNGLFEKQTTPAIHQAFNIAGGADFTHPNNPAYRKAIIALEPNPNKSEGGFKISVTIQHGEQKTPVIENFTYPSTLKYIENGLPRDWSSGIAQLVTSPPIEEYTVNRPEKIAIGFTGSTGRNTAYTNIIKNLRITPLYAANTVNDDIWIHRRGPVTISPFDNDLGYKEEGGSIIGDKDFIDPNSFRFWTDEKHCLDATYEYVVNGKGKWIYDPAVGKVMFFPVKGFTGEVSIMYDVKGIFAPFSQEKFRSSLATINITISDNQP